MTFFRKTLTALIVVILGAAMTMPLQVALELPGAIVENTPPSLGYRVGVVVDLVEAEEITVAISGSAVLVTASYLFPQYLPVLGDRVYVVKQDGQWFVLGTMSGPINSVIQNPSFEEGVLGATPTGWTIQVLGSAAGVPTFTKVSAGNDSMTGSFKADFGVDNAGALNVSSANVFSSTALASEGQRWTAAYYLTNAFIDNDSVNLSSEGEPTFLDFYIQFLDGGGTLITETLMNSISMNVDSYSRLYRRPSVAQQYAMAPAGTVSVRVKFFAEFFQSATSFTSLFIDYVILRRA